MREGGLSAGVEEVRKDQGAMRGERGIVEGYCEGVRGEWVMNVLERTRDDEVEKEGSRGMWVSTIQGG
jgi:hypothetical protein